MATGILANPAPDQKNGRLDMRIKTWGIVTTQGRCFI